MNKSLEQSPPYKTFIWLMIGFPFLWIASVQIKSISGEWLASTGTLIWMYSAYCYGKYDAKWRGR